MNFFSMLIKLGLVLLASPALATMGEMRECFFVQQAQEGTFLKSIGLETFVPTEICIYANPKMYSPGSQFGLEIRDGNFALANLHVIIFDGGAPLPSTKKSTRGTSGAIVSAKVHVGDQPGYHRLHQTTNLQVVIYFDQKLSGPINDGNKFVSALLDRVMNSGYKSRGVFAIGDEFYYLLDDDDWGKGRGPPRPPLPIQPDCDNILNNGKQPAYVR